MLTVREWLTKNKSKYEDREKWVEACMEELGVVRKTVMIKARIIWPLEGKTQLDSVSSNKKMDKDFLMDKDEFLTGIDVVKQILGFLDEVVGDAYIEDEKLRRRFEVSLPKWKEICDLPVFEGRRFRYTKGSGQKGIVWSSEAGVEEAKKTISMARYEF